MPAQGNQCSRSPLHPHAGIASLAGPWRRAGGSGNAFAADFLVAAGEGRLGRLEVATGWFVGGFSSKKIPCNSLPCEDKEGTQRVRLPFTPFFAGIQRRLQLSSKSLMTDGSLVGEKKNHCVLAFKRQVRLDKVK